MWKHVASTGLTLLVAALLAVAALIGWARHVYEAPGPLASPVCFEVPRGATLTRVSRDLAARGVISWPTVLRAAANYTGRAGQLKAGSYLIPAHASMREILDSLTSSGRSTCGTEILAQIGVARLEVDLRGFDPETGTYRTLSSFRPGEGGPPEGYLQALDAPGTRLRVTVAEGVTSWQVVRGLEALDFLSGKVESVPEEGWLAPGSYEVKAGTERVQLLARMRERQERILAEEWAGRAEGLPLKTPEEALILASIIEKETGVPEERALIASVFINRLRIGMPLQTDPTVIYGITRGREPLGRGLRRSELRRRTPWNTYVIKGLPPTPIANPGRAAIHAALHPADSDYLFFVADGSGGHVFAATNREHERNVRRWRQIERQRQQD